MNGIIILLILLCSFTLIQCHEHIEGFHSPPMSFQARHNMTAPDWVTPEIMDDLRKLKDFGYEILFEVYKRQEKSRLQGGNANCQNGKGRNVFQLSYLHFLLYVLFSDGQGCGAVGNCPVPPPWFPFPHTWAQFKLLLLLFFLSSIWISPVG